MASVLWIACSGVACSNVPEQEGERSEAPRAPAAAANVAANPKSDAIVLLRTRDHVIAVHGNGSYTVRAMNGAVVAENLTLQELKAQHPEAAKVVSNGRAQPYLDGRAYELPHSDPHSATHPH